MAVTEPRGEGYDAVIVGGALGGLAAGAILARRGWRVALVQPLEADGGRVGAVERDGWWLGWGHRDGHGIGDLAFIPVYAPRAAEAAGAELRLRPFVGDSVRVHWLPAGTTSELPADVLIAGDGDPMDTCRGVVRMFGGAQVDVETTAKGFLEVQTRLAMIDDDEAWRLVPVRMGDWLARNVDDPSVRHVMLQQFECMPFTPAEETSVGRYVMHLKTVRGMAVIPDDDEVGGMQGLVAPFARAFAAHGGERWTGWKPLEIVVEDHQARGVVALDEAGVVQVLEAPVVITDLPGWDLPSLVDEALLPAEWVERARALERYGADVVTWWAGLSRLPTRRDDGCVEDLSSPWHRVLLGEGALKRCHGGFYFPSGFSAKAAPPGKHLLGAEICATGEADGRGWPRWADAKHAVDLLVDHLHRYYADLDDCIEWSRYQYVTPPQYLSWYAKPVYRHPVRVTTVDGLYVASSTAEGIGGWADMECAAALEAVEHAEQDFGRR